MISVLETSDWALTGFVLSTSRKPVMDPSPLRSWWVSDQLQQHRCRALRPVAGTIAVAEVPACKSWWMRELMSTSSIVPMAILARAVHRYVFVLRLHCCTLALFALLFAEQNAWAGCGSPSWVHRIWIGPLSRAEKWWCGGIFALTIHTKKRPCGTYMMEVGLVEAALPDGVCLGHVPLWWPAWNEEGAVNAHLPWDAGWRNRKFQVRKKTSTLGCPERW